MTTEIEHWRSVQKLLRGYRAAQVLITCTQLGVFQHLAGGPQTASELAAKTGADPRALERLLRAAVGLELLVLEGGNYANAPLAATCLAREGPFFLGNLVRREGAFYQRWSYLPEAVRTGRRPEPNVRDEDQTNWVLDFELALYDLARTLGPVVAEALALPAGRPVRVLDVGGGHGGYSMALVRRYPNAEATVFELPAAAAVARDIIAAEGLAERVSVQVGDFQQDELGSEFDLALLFGVLVSETPAGKLALLRKTFAALAPGGTVAIRGFGYSPRDGASLEAALFSVQMLLSTSAGDISTVADLEGWLGEAGFEAPRLIDLPEWAGSALYVARKPE